MIRDRIQSHTKSGKIQLENYKVGTLKKYQIDDLLLENTCSREDSKEELQKKLANTTNIEEFLKLAKELGEERKFNRRAKKAPYFVGNCRRYQKRCL